MIEIYKTDLKYIICSTALEIKGIVKICEPIFHVAIDDNIINLFETIKKALHASGKKIKIDDEKQYTKNILKTIGETSWNALRKNSKLCSFEIEKDYYIISPHHKKGAGYMSREDEIIKVSNTENIETITKMLINAFSLCK